jgi:hypothetical protein
MHINGYLWHNPLENKAILRVKPVAIRRASNAPQTYFLVQIFSAGHSADPLPAVFELLSTRFALFFAFEIAGPLSHGCLL